MKEIKQTTFFNTDEFKYWKLHWKEMPEFNQEKLAPYRSLIIHFDCQDDINEFAEIINQKITPNTKSLWHPKLVVQDEDRYMNKRYEDKKFTAPQYPLYIVTKGRFESRLTSRALETMRVPHTLVVEEEEYYDYDEAIQDCKFAKLLVLDKKFQDEYETCDDLGDTKSKGPGPARNFVWDHSIKQGYKWHWVMDDNIKLFLRHNNNLKVPVSSGAIFRCMEDFCERYENVTMAGPNYFMFIPRKEKLPAFVINTRIYSCNLIRNDCPHRWRGRYNEDTILSLDMLKDDMCTVQFNAFVQDKTTTQVLKGGNTDEFYSKEGTMPKSKMLEDVHPDVAKVKWKFNRWHHFVDYTRFKKNKLKLKDGIVLNNCINNYNMELRKIY